MIKEGVRILVVTAVSQENWRIRVVGPPCKIWQYFPKPNHSNDISGISLSEYALMMHSTPYFKIEKDPEDDNPCSLRIVSFVVDVSQWIRKYYLKLFVFPKQIIKDMKVELGIEGQNRKITDVDWIIHRSGVGLSTRYKVKLDEPRNEFDENEWSIINGTVKMSSIPRILIDGESCFTQRIYTPFNRFDIMEIE